jgi:flagellar biosynthesis anti-sigma factor FlgM
MRVGASYSKTGPETQATNANKEASKTGSASSSAASSSASAASEGAVKVTLSAKARELDEAQSPEASEKVQRLRAAVESGNLPIDPQKIAAAIIGE